MERAEGRGRSQDELLFDDTGFGVVLGQLRQTLLQRVPQEVQTLGCFAQTRLCLRGGHGAALVHIYETSIGTKPYSGGLRALNFFPDTPPHPPGS